MVDLASPEARERIANVVRRALWKLKTPEHIGGLGNFIGIHESRIVADAALAEVAAMLKEE